jgi:aldose sugar dehydrogenase
MLARFAAVSAALLLFAGAPDQAAARDGVFEAGTGPVLVETVARGLEHPWAVAFLPDGRYLVTERPGRMRIVAADGSLSEPVAGVPAVYDRNQGGLLDLALDPGFADNGVVFFTFAHPDGPDAGTAVARAVLVADAAPPRLDDVAILFTQNNKNRSGRHFGSRLVVAPDGTIFFSIGDRGTMERAQDPLDHAGTVMRIARDGSVPADNPFLGDDAVDDHIWSWGHRNIQGMAVHPGTGVVWTHEHGPRGGDEINIPLAGANHGWPIITHGTEYSGATIGEGITEREGFVSPLYHWTPSIAPSGMAFYAGDVFPQWQGDMLVGALAGTALHRVSLDGEEIVGDERMLGGLGARIRDVRVGPDGHVYLLTDAADGRLLRLSPDG